jgi:hypothetical protein
VNHHDVAKKNFERFKSLEGSKHIATLGSQHVLAELLSRFEPKAILDWGSGIGTLLQLANDVCHPRLFAYEENSWCRERARENLTTLKFEYISTSDTPKDLDAVFIDAGIEIDQLDSILMVDTLQFIYVEGWRNTTCIQISKRLRAHGYSAKFTRPGGLVAHYRRSDSYEKRGSFFVLRKEKKLRSAYSRIARIFPTGELVTPAITGYFKLAEKTYSFRHPNSN